MSCATKKLTEADVQNFTLIHAFRNEWRQRYVCIHEHPSDPTKVVTMGYVLAATGGVTTIPPVICIEDRSRYARIIDRKIKRVE